jgi:phosphate transport system substrate-binding protein
MKKRNWIVPLFTALIICSLPSTGCSEPHQRPLRLNAAGSGVNLGIMRLLAKAFMERHSEVIIEVPGSIGTKGAIAAVADGAITFGLISRSLKDEEKSKGLVARPYARVPIVVGAHPAVVDVEITFQDLIDVYRGAKTQWKDTNKIVVQTREPFDSGFMTLEEKIPGFREAYLESRQERRWPVYFTDQDANRALSATPYAIGITDLGMIATEHLDIKVLKLNGIAPSPETLLSGQYPLSRVLSFLYREGTLPEEAKAFFDFAGSGEGGKILWSNGYLPMN